MGVCGAWGGGLGSSLSDGDGQCSTRLDAAICLVVTLAVTAFALQSAGLDIPRDVGARAAAGLWELRRDGHQARRNNCSF